MPARTYPPLAPDDLLAGRYRLVTLCNKGPSATLWRATDEVLARTVSVKVLSLTGPGAAVADAFLVAASRASVLTAAGLARVYDAAQETRTGPRGGVGITVAYVVSEWVQGRPLSLVLAQDGPLEAMAVARLGVAAAEALEAVHCTGLAHGRVHPNNLLLTDRGRLRLVDTAVAAALTGGPPPLLGAAQIAADTRQLAACLYAAATGHWPGTEDDDGARPGPAPGPTFGLPAAPHLAGGAAAPRQVRAGIPRALDEVIGRALDPRRHPAQPALTTPAALAATLRPLLAAAAERAAAQRPGPARPPSLLRRLLPWTAAALVITGFSAATFVAGRSVGTLPPPPGGLTVLSRPGRAGAPGTAALVAWDLLGPGITVSDYNPDGDGHENASTVVNAYDQDPITAWSTSTYRTAAFGGLKPGVGLLVDFGAPVTVTQVALGLTTGGADLQIRAGDALGQDETSLPVLVNRPASATAETFVLPAGSRHRYFLIWITRLPPGLGTRSRVGISAMVLSH